MKRAHKCPIAWFVACDDGTFFCQHCLPANIDPGDDATEVWESGLTDWEEEVRCDGCDALLGERETDQ